VKRGGLGPRARRGAAVRSSFLAFGLATPIAAAIALAACSRDSGPLRERATLAAAPAPSRAIRPHAEGPAPSHEDGGSARDGEAARTGSADDALAAAHSIGNTSVAFKLTFESGAKAAFKPRSKRGRDRYKGEIAAYRIGRALDLDNVPAVAFERVSVSDLARALAPHPPSLALAKNELVADADGRVPGAAIPWIADLDVLRLESEPWRAKWRAWLLSGEPIADGDRALAAQVATMIVFDALTGNWDRWSGANVGWDAKARRLLFIDNDGAFMVPTPAPFERQRELLRTLEKFPRALLARLRAMDEAALRGAVGDESPGVPLLSAAAIHDADARRQAIVAAADARIHELGESRVVVFE
jgi:hypothetical protein